MALALAIFASHLPGIGPFGIASAAPTTQGTSSPKISFTNAAVEVREGQSAQIGVQLSAAATSDLSFNYTVTWPDGRAGAAGGTVEFPAGDTSAVITIDVEDDDVVSTLAREDFTVTLHRQNPDGSGARSVPSSAPTKNVTILEGVCDRSDNVRQKIVEVATTATECHQVTDADLNTSFADVLDWGGTVTNNPLGALKEGDFRGMSSVTTLKLGNNSLTFVPADAFDGLSALETLDISDNNIATLGTDAFDGLSALETLNVSNNDIETLGTDAFDGLSALETLNVSNNDIETLDGDAFNGLSALETPQRLQQ